MIGNLGFDPNEFPDRDSLPTIEERVGFLMGRMLEQAPPLARPVLRSMLLPKLETLSSESLAEILGDLHGVVLPWLLTGDLPVAVAAYVPDQG